MLIMISTWILISPMIIVLLSLAFMPVLFLKFWSKTETIILSVIAIASIIFDFYLLPNTGELLKYTIFVEYIPFIIMLFTLYTLSSGIHIKIHTAPTTLANIIFLAIGGILSSFIGTTGSAMLLIRPFLEFNSERKHKAHLIIFFIIIVANIGGLLTPLGDPPLLLGYLHGVEFSWTLIHLSKYWSTYIALCLTILYFIDKILNKSTFSRNLVSRDLVSRDLVSRGLISRNNILNNVSGDNISKVNISGYFNIILIILTAVILFTNINIYIKNILLLIISTFSILKNTIKIDFHPFIEVVRTFLVIFIVLAPVLYLIEQDSEYIQKFINSDNNMLPYSYFKLCGFASSFLDNAPSYLLCVKMTGHSVYNLMNENSNLLIAISVSSVVMGSLTYIGNAPNMMVKNIASYYKIKMPSFISYFVISCLIVIPISILIIKFFNFQ